MIGSQFDRVKLDPIWNLISIQVGYWHNFFLKWIQKLKPKILNRLASSWPQAHSLQPRTIDTELRAHTTWDMAAHTQLTALSHQVTDETTDTYRPWCTDTSCCSNVKPSHCDMLMRPVCSTSSAVASCSTSHCNYCCSLLHLDNHLRRSKSNNIFYGLFMSY